MTAVEFPLKPGQAPVKFRFTIPNVRSMEKEAGVGIDLLRLRGQTVDALCLLTCYALKWADRKMTTDTAADLIQTYLEDGGTVEALSQAVVKALNESGVYGKPEMPADPDGEDADPTTATATS